MDNHVLDQIRKLRDETGAGVIECKKAFEEALGDYRKALRILADLGAKKLEKKAERAVGDGLVEAYVHSGGKVGAMVELRCETDFVARTPEFQHLTHEIAMQVASMDPKDADELLKQEYIRDSSKTISGLIKDLAAKVGENIRIEKFARFGI